MKGFGSAKSASLISLLYFAAHLPFLAPSLEDIDSINFALGLRDFDVATHQPHPPGYPVYIALGRLSLPAVHAVAPTLAAARAEALALSIWSAIAGAVALAAAGVLFTSIGGPKRTAAWAVALLAVAPLFWLAGLRPMSDLPGLALALVAQALFVRGPGHPPLLVAGAFVAGLAAGIRVQTILLTLPLLMVVCVRAFRTTPASPPSSPKSTTPPTGAGALWLITRVGAGLAAGVFVWLVPLLAASGGVDGYLRALATQAGEDFAWVDMLWANPTPRRLALSLYETVILPWSAAALAGVVVVAALVGAALAIVREPRGLAVLAAAFVPYVLFHLLFQETFTVRYALPVLPAVAWLAVRGAMVLGRAGSVAAGALVVLAAAVALPGGVAYGAEAHPAFRAIDDMRMAAGNGRPAAVYSHYALRRPLQAAPPGLPVVEPPRQAEWLGLVDYWRRGAGDAVWFLADPRRTDLDLIDPHARDPVRYRWRVGERPELRGTRPLGVDWYRFDPPGWFAGEGWSLTPETAGLARATGTGLDVRPIEAYVRRGRGPMHLVVGGGYLDASPRPGGVVTFDLSVDGEAAASWTLKEGEGRFLHFIDLPAGVPAGSSRYATLAIAARTEQAQRAAPVAVREFDIQPADRMIHAFGEGWHEEEYDNATGLRWRWTSGRSVLRVWPPRAVRLTLRGESPLVYFDEPPNVQITAAGRVIAAFRPADAFEWQVIVPEEAVQASGGAIAIETDRVYLPAEAEGTADSRRLGLRLFDTAVHPVSP